MQSHCRHDICEDRHCFSAIASCLSVHFPDTNAPRKSRARQPTIAAAFTPFRSPFTLAGPKRYASGAMSPSRALLVQGLPVLRSGVDEQLRQPPDCANLVGEG